MFSSNPLYKTGVSIKSTLIKIKGCLKKSTRVERACPKQSAHYRKDVSNKKLFGRANSIVYSLQCTV